MLRSIKYRPEIDGLRGISIISIILFHAGFDITNGGYVGVDIFFVISGYLITLIRIDALERGSQSILAFYKHRVLRIFPALFFIMIVCLFFAYAWMTQYELNGFFKSLLATTLFVSNIYFWKSIGYFDIEAELKPLLHTWSLSVEMQFYIIFPIFLYCIWGLDRKKVFFILLTLGLASLLISEWGWRNSPTANFYLFSSRAWEFLVGVAVAFYMKHFDVKDNNFLSCIGLISIILSVFLYDQKTPAPSYLTILPVAGTALILLFSGTKSAVTKILSAKLIRWVGLISYSTYLWHYPVFSFSKIMVYHPISLSYTIVLILLSLVLGALTWKYIEKPFRYGGKINKKTIYIVSSVGLLILVIPGYFVIINTAYFANSIDKNNFQQLKEIQSSANCVKQAGVNVFSDCTVILNPNGKKILLLGDSYSHSLKYFFKNFENSQGIKSITFAAHLDCSKIWSNETELKKYDEEFCSKYHESLHKNSIANDIDVVVFWSRFHIPNGNYEDVTREFDVVKKRISLFAKTTPVIVLSPVPTYTINAYKFWRSDYLIPLDKNEQYTYSSFYHELKWYYEYFEGKTLKNVFLIDVARFMCVESSVCKLGDLNSPYYIDSNHLSSDFIKIVQPELYKVINKN